jgi:hypothetical protein
MDPITYTLFRGASNAGPVYVDDVFNVSAGKEGSSGFVEVINDINLLDYGGMTLVKPNVESSINGAPKLYSTETTGQYFLTTGSLTGITDTDFQFTKSGFSGYSTPSGQNYITFSFRRAAKFFDMVTYTGNGTSQSINHNLECDPGFIIVRRTDASGDWVCWHKDMMAGLPTGYILLNETGLTSGNSSYTGFPWNSTEPNSTSFSVGTSGAGATPSGRYTNISGATYVAYIFADGSANGFGEDGSESIIKCGTYTSPTDSGFSGYINVDLGWEPELVLAKKAYGANSSGNDWKLLSLTHNFTSPEFASQAIEINQTQTANVLMAPLSSGFQGSGASLSNAGAGVSDTTWIYMAVRKSMRPPIDPAKVFTTFLINNDSSTDLVVDYGIKADSIAVTQRTGTGTFFYPRFLGGGTTFVPIKPLQTGYASGRITTPSSVRAYSFSTGVRTLGDNFNRFIDLYDFVHYVFTNAAGFFDQGLFGKYPSGIRQVKHNLHATPELLIVSSWGESTQSTYYIYTPFNGTDEYLDFSSASGLTYLSGVWNGTTPNETHFSIDTSKLSISGDNPWSDDTFFFLAFASLQNISKINTYTGTELNQNIDCGFTNGARFILIKRIDTSTSGDWYVWDAGRGIVGGNDPYTRWNINGAEVSTSDFIDPYSPGFTVTDTASGTVNISGAVYLYFAVA